MAVLFVVVDLLLVFVVVVVIDSVGSRGEVQGRPRSTAAGPRRSAVVGAGMGRRGGEGGLLEEQ